MDNALIGRQFGRLTVMAPEVPRNRSPQWRCVCSCGKEIVVSEHNLTSGHTKSCGCIKSPDRTGQRFGSLVVIGRSEKRGKRGKRTVPLWECRCDCGETVYRAMDSLTTRKNCSCEKCMEQSKTTEMRKYAGFVGGTQISKITDMKLSSANTSGVRGVYFEKKTSLWRARLRFRGKMFDFGSYRHLEDAAKARACGEEEIYQAFLADIGL